MLKRDRNAHLPLFPSRRSGEHIKKVAQGRLPKCTARQLSLPAHAIYDEPDEKVAKPVPQRNIYKHINTSLIASRRDQKPLSHIAFLLSCSSFCLRIRSFCFSSRNKSASHIHVNQKKKLCRSKRRGKRRHSHNSIRRTVH
jgi:hypothetical protein